MQSYQVKKISTASAFEKGYLQHLLVDNADKNRSFFSLRNDNLDDIINKKSNVFSIIPIFSKKIEESQFSTIQEQAQDSLSYYKDKIYSYIVSEAKHLERVVDRDKKFFLIDIFSPKSENHKKLDKIIDFLKTHKAEDLDYLFEIKDSPFLIMIKMIDTPVYVVKPIDTNISSLYNLNTRDDVGGIKKTMPKHIGFHNKNGLGYPIYQIKDTDNIDRQITPFKTHSLFGEIENNDYYLVFDSKNRAILYVNSSIRKMKNILENIQDNVNQANSL